MSNNLDLGLIGDYWKHFNRYDLKEAHIVYNKRDQQTGKLIAVLDSRHKADESWLNDFAKIKSWDNIEVIDVQLTTRKDQYVSMRLMNNPAGNIIAQNGPQKKRLIGLPLDVSGILREIG